MSRREVSGTPHTAVIAINRCMQKTAQKNVHAEKKDTIGARTAHSRDHAHTRFEPSTGHYAAGARSGAALRSPSHPRDAHGCKEAMSAVFMRR